MAKYSIMKKKLIEIPEELFKQIEASAKKNVKYFNIAKKRIKDVQMQRKLF